MLGSICVCPVSQLRGKLGSEEEPAQTVMNLIFKSSCCLKGISHPPQVFVRPKLWTHFNILIDIQEVLFKRQSCS